MKYLIFVKHLHCDTRFLFEVPEGIVVHKGDYLLCDTRMGLAFGIADSEPFGGFNNEIIAKEFGVDIRFSPLKMVVNVCSPSLFQMARHFIEQNKKTNNIVLQIVGSSDVVGIPSEEDLPF